MAEATFLQAADGCWHLRGEIGFSSVPQVLLDSKKCFVGGRQIQIDLKGVTRADSAALALLLEWLRIAQRSGNRVSFINVPQQLRAIAGLCDLEAILPI